MVLCLGLLEKAVAQQTLPFKKSKPGAKRDRSEPLMPFLKEHQLHAIHYKLDSDADDRGSFSELQKYATDVRMATMTQTANRIMKQNDQDKNEKLTLDEWLVNWTNSEQRHHYGDEYMLQRDKDRIELETKKFKAFDDNGDGRLDLRELTSFIDPHEHGKMLTIMTEENMKTKDKNGDSKLSLEEFVEEPDDIDRAEKAQFKKLDRDGDGFLNVNELEPWEETVINEQKREADVSLRKIFNLADEDEDGHISAAELAKLAKIDPYSSSSAEWEAHFHLSKWVKHHEL